VVALVGPNGSGKSTLLRALAGALPYEGTIADKGRLRSAANAVDPRELSWLPQRLDHPAGMTVEEVVELGRTSWLQASWQGRLFGRISTDDKRAIDAALHSSRLLGHRQAALETLSGGQRQRAFLAMVLAQQSGVLLLDEPTSSLDPSYATSTVELLIERIRDKSGLLVMAIHDLPLALQCADQLVVLSAGTVLSSDAPTSESTHLALKRAFGDQALTTLHAGLQALASSRADLAGV
jgi:iron complex transport system ATP-binding protein